MFLTTVGGQRQWVSTKTKYIWLKKQGEKAVFEILVPNPAFPKAATEKGSHGGIIQWHSGLRRTGSDPVVVTHSTTLILTTRPHLCHSFSAPSQRCCKFKVPRFHLSIHYRSLFRWDLLQHHTRDTKSASVFTCVGWWKCASSDETLQILTHYFCLRLTLVKLSVPFSVQKICQMKKSIILKSSKQEVWNILNNKLIVHNTIQYS